MHSEKGPTWTRNILSPVIALIFFSLVYIIMSLTYRDVGHTMSISPKASKVHTGQKGSVYMDDKVIVRLLKKTLNDGRSRFFERERGSTRSGTKQTANRTAYFVTNQNGKSSEINQYQYKIYSDKIPEQKDPPAGFKLIEKETRPVVKMLNDSKQNSVGNLQVKEQNQSIITQNGKHNENISHTNHIVNTQTQGETGNGNENISHRNRNVNTQTQRENGNGNDNISHRIHTINTQTQRENGNGNDNISLRIHTVIPQTQRENGNGNDNISHRIHTVNPQTQRENGNGSENISHVEEARRNLTETLHRLKKESAAIIEKLSLLNRNGSATSRIRGNHAQVMIANTIDRNQYSKGKIIGPTPNKFNIHHINKSILNAFGNTETNEIERKTTSGIIATTRGPINRPIHTTERPDNCENCFIRPYDFMINSPEVCYGLRMDYAGQPELQLLVLITTIPQHRSRRDGIRSTWAGLTAKNTNPRARYIFLMGHASDELDREVAVERDENKDIALQNFNDAYANLTLKTLMGLQWSENFCPGARYIMKTDDDVYVHVPNILSLIKGNNLEGSIFGTCSLDASPIRDKSSKWYVSNSQFPHSRYPGFCSGTGYVLSRKVAKDILHVSPSIPFFYLEDVYMSLCADKLGYKLKNVFGFNNWKLQIHTGSCGLYGGRYFYTSHGIIPPELQDIWKRCGQTSI